MLLELFAVLTLSGTPLCSTGSDHVQPGCRTPRSRSLRPLSSTRTSGTVQSDQLRRRPAARTSDCGGDPRPRDATLETRARSRPVRGRATVERRADRPASAVDRGRHVAGRSGRPAAAAPVGRWMATRYPDLVVTMPQPYVLPSQTRDVFRTFVIPIPVEAASYVKAVEFHPGNHRIVHHANIKIDRTRLSRRRDEDEAGAGYEGGGSREARFPDGMFLGWTPGQSPRVSPEDMSWHLEPQSDLVVELHLMPGAKPEPVQVSVGFFFTDRAPTRTGYMLRLGRQDIDIAAGRRDYVNADAYTLPVDVDALAIQPHAHFLAREVRAWATLPDGANVPLISIKDWDFHWQDVYTYARPIVLPKGTRIEMQYVYDNSDANRRNPNRPPRRVTFGQTSASEMGSLWLQVVPRNAGDLARPRPRLRAEDSSRRYRGKREMAGGGAGQRRAASGAGCLLSRGESSRRRAVTAQRGGTARSRGRASLRCRACAAPSGEIRRSRAPRSERALSLQSRVCRSDLRARGGPPRPEPD